MIIAIDGPSGAGKGAAATALAKELDFLHFDTGAMYRSLAYLALRLGTDLNDEAQLEDLIARFDYHIEKGPRYLLGDEDITGKIRTPEVTLESSKVAAIPRVRAAMVEIQRDHASRGDIVCEGRDMGTVVFPNAEVKVFLTASPKVRAERRYLQLKEGDPDLRITLDEILENQRIRDERDTNREASPLRVAEGAFVLDTSNMTLKEVVATLVAHVRG